MLEERLNARQIVMRAGMSARPEFYSGRGAISCDLNDRILENVYQTIQREHGEKAAQQFAQMVADIPELSATDFLLSLYRLESHNWKWDKSMMRDERGIAIGPDYGDGKREANAFAGIVTVLGGSDLDQTRYIRGEFLKRHKIEVPQKGPMNFDFSSNY